ncbi:MAG: gliding motility-associated ABC transporter permease subunit GldF [Salibacteraceae bacterium]
MHQVISLLKKEIWDFLSSLIGYLVIAVFLCAVSLFMWVFPLGLNVLNSGFANLDALFVLGPWVFLFLCPAVTMRLFAEEQRTGTIELLLTKPLTEWQIVLAKFLAGWILVLISLVPTLLYYYSVYQLGSPPGNLDSGGIWGSYIGLLMLAGAYVSIGVFASSLTNNQIVSFILAVFLSFVLYIGLESASALFDAVPFAERLLVKLGINAHYMSMSRGVIDTRDMLYFASLIGLFLLFTKTRLDSRKW